MKFLLPFFLIFGQQALASLLTIEATYSVSGDYAELDQAEATAAGWTFNEDEEVYIFSKQISASELPLRMQLGEAHLSISTTGRLSSGMSVGDADAGADLDFYLPMENGEFVKLPDLKLETSGGDYASGSWSFYSEIRLSFQ